MKRIGIVPETYRILLQLGKIVGALTFLFGIPYGVEQYLEKQYEGRVSETLEFYKQFNNPPVSTYRENITKALVANDAAIVAASAKGADALGDVVMNMVDQRGIETDLLMTMDFFDGLVTCVEKTLCDRETAQSLFSPRARDLFVNFYQYIEQRRTTSAGPNFAMGLQVTAQKKLK